MDIKLKNQLLYLITDEKLGYLEYNLPSCYYTDSHIEAYSNFLLANPELGMTYDLSSDRYLPEQLSQEGVVVYIGCGSINPEYREMFYNFEYSGALLLPKNFTLEQKKKLAKKMEELSKIYFEFTYYKDDMVQNVCDTKSEGSKYKVYQKLERIVNYNE